MSLKKEYAELSHQILAPLSVDERVELVCGRLSFDPNNTRVQRLGEFREQILELDPDRNRALSERIEGMSKYKKIEIITAGRQLLNRVR